MKKSIILFLFIPLAGFGQKDSLNVKKWMCGINLSSSEGIDEEFSIDFYARKGHHFFSVGQKIFISHYTYYQHQYGAELDYRYYIGKKQRHLKCFIPVHSDLLFLTVKNDGIANNSPPYNGSTFTQKGRLASFSLFTGFGLDLRIGQRFHLSLFPGIGYVFWNFKSSYTFSSDPSLNTEYKAGFFHDPYWDLMIKGGIGFDLVRRRK